VDEKRFSVEPIKPNFLHVYGLLTKDSNICADGILEKSY